MTNSPSKGIAKNHQVHNRHHKGHDHNERITEKFFEIPFEDCNSAPDHNGLLPREGVTSGCPPLSSFLPVRWIKTSSREGDRIDIEVIGMKIFPCCKQFPQYFTAVFAEMMSFCVF
jgi:hypothetical protein